MSEGTPSPFAAPGALDAAERSLRGARVDMGGVVAAPGGTGIGTRIIGGETVFIDQEGRNPFAAYVQLRKVTRNALGSDVSSFVCGGAVVHAWRSAGATDDGAPARLAGIWVATASHCLDPSAEYQVALWDGAGNANVPAETPVALAPATRLASRVGSWRMLGPQGVTVFRHPLYSDKPQEHDYDVALLRVMLPPGTDLPVALQDPSREGGVAWDRLPSIARRPPVRNTEAVALGFGLTTAPTKSDKPASVSPTLQKLQAVVQPTQFSWRASEQEDAMFLWVVGLPALLGQKISSTCNGDSGGPLLVPDAASPDQGAYVLAGVLCCGYCKAVEDEAQLSKYPSWYTRLDAFMGPAQGEAAELLRPDSVWRQGILGIIARYSPVQYRTAQASAEAPASVAAPEETWSSGEMQWVEASGARDLTDTYWRGLMRLAIVVAVAFIGSAIVVTAVQIAFNGLMGGSSTTSTIRSRTRNRTRSRTRTRSK